jgi:hypothetical protein
MRNPKFARLAKVEAALSPPGRWFSVWVDAELSGAEADAEVAEKIERLKSDVGLTERDTIFVARWGQATDR